MSEQLTSGGAKMWGSLAGWFDISEKWSYHYLPSWMPFPSEKPRQITSLLKKISCWCRNSILWADVIALFWWEEWLLFELEVEKNLACSQHDVCTTVARCTCLASTQENAISSQFCFQIRYCKELCLQWVCNECSLLFSWRSITWHGFIWWFCLCFVAFHAASMSAPSPGVQYMVKAVSKGYLMEQGLQQKVIQDLGLSAISQHECHMFRMLSPKSSCDNTSCTLTPEAIKKSLPSLIGVMENGQFSTFGPSILKPQGGTP